MKQKGLGRGLDAIFSLDAPQQSSPMSGVDEIEVSAIVPNPKQPRTHFDEAALEELADSIRTLGIIQPITVRPQQDGRYIIISGERRWRAAQLAELKTVPAYVRDVDDQNLHEMALVENIQRQDLNAVEVAVSLQRLMDECGLTQDALSQRVGKKRSTIANYLRLLNQPPEVQLAVREGALSLGHAKALAAVAAEEQVPLLRKCLKKGLSVRQTEQLVAERQQKVKNATPEEEYPESYLRLVEQLEKFFSQNISIKNTKNGKGRIVIEFDGEGDVRRFLERFENVNGR